jgi:hypothetical protein
MEKPKMMDSVENNASLHKSPTEYEPLYLMTETSHFQNTVGEEGDQDYGQWLK